MLCGEMKEEGDIIVNDVEPDAFKEMLRYFNLLQKIVYA